MLRANTLWVVGVAMSGLVSCARDERSRVSTIDVECIDPTCGSVRPDATFATGLNDGGRDATVLNASSEGGASPNAFDGFVPPFAADSGAGVDASMGSQDASISYAPPLDTTVCAEQSPGTLAFRTDFLDAVEGSPGTGIAGAPLALRTAWHHALVATGTPGPALIVLSNLGLLADGGTRHLRFGTPDSRLIADASFDRLYFFERAPSGSPPLANPLAGAFSVQNTTRVQGALLAASGVSLRFANADGSRYDVPVSAVSIDGFLRSDPSGSCTALDVVDLALGIPSSAVDATLDGASLASLFGASASTSSLLIVHLAGPAAVVPFAEVP